MSEAKIPVGILGATGMVGQKLIELLNNHPLFEIKALAASERSSGKKYSEIARWMMPSSLPQRIGEMSLQPSEPPLPCQLVFSGLDASVAGEIESNFAKEGYTVISNSRNHRMDVDVPLLIGDVNASHLELIHFQKTKGKIITNPNCTVAGLATALKPLVDNWGIEKINVVTLQAISGAGYPGIPSYDIWDNVIPFISGEEEKVENEPKKILGTFTKDGIVPYPMDISAQCNRVGVMDGHMACVSVKLRSKASPEDIIFSWENFSSDSLGLPTAPQFPLKYLNDERHPQPKLHRNLNKGMTVSIGRLRKCPLLDWKFVILSHNTVRGAAGCTIMNAELMYKKDYLSVFANTSS